MNVKYFVNQNLIPDDGTKEIIDIFNKNIDFSHTGIYIYPDVHYKKGSRVVNGMLIKSNNYIYPACLGVENCGFTFGKIEGSSIETLQESFKKYSEKLKSYEAYEKYSWSYIKNLFIQYLAEDFNNRPDFYKFIGVDNLEQAINKANKALTRYIRKRSIRSLCSLGGGNHFFEIHQIVQEIKENDMYKKDDFIFILHSDSITVGDIINLRYSNLSEWDFMVGFNAIKRKLKFRLRQFLYFLSSGCFFKNPLETFKLLYSQKDYRGININSCVGKNLMFEHNLATFFGEINRDLIIKNWANENNIKLENIVSHNHDSITYEDGTVVHRNGVQYVGDDKYFLLPSAMGNFSYILENPKNKTTFYSSNHGTGRLQDKHIARENFTEEKTARDLREKGICLCRVGKGKLAEQNLNAFKDISTVLDEMQKNNLGVPVAKTKPIAIIKG